MNSNPLTIQITLHMVALFFLVLTRAFSPLFEMFLKKYSDVLLFYSNGMGKSIELKGYTMTQNGKVKSWAHGNVFTKQNNVFDKTEKSNIKSSSKICNVNTFFLQSSPFIHWQFAIYSLANSFFILSKVVPKSCYRRKIKDFNIIARATFQS